MSENTPSLIARLTRRKRPIPPSARRDGESAQDRRFLGVPATQSEVRGSTGGGSGPRSGLSVHDGDAPPQTPTHRDDVQPHSDDVPKRRRRRDAPRRDLSLEHPRLRAELAVVIYPWKGRDGLAPLEDELVAEALAAFQSSGRYEVAAAMTRDRQPVVLGDTLVDQFLNRTEFAARVGVKPSTLSRYDLPAPDVLVGSGSTAQRGWRVSTVLEWQASRPEAGSR